MNFLKKINTMDVEVMPTRIEMAEMNLPMKVLAKISP